MIFSKRRKQSSVPGGFYRFENVQTKASMTGFGDGEFVRLRDEFGKVWSGSAEVENRDSIRYRFRDENGKSITGISDSFGIVLRDEKGKTWRGFMQ